MENLQTNKPSPIEFLAKFDTTVLAGLVFLGLGGGVISFYYSHIRYLPDIEWSQSIVHLATATLIGGGLAILLALSLFLPGCIWSYFLLRDKYLETRFWFGQQTPEICIYTLLKRLGIPFVTTLFINHIVLFGAEKLWKDHLLDVYGIASVILMPVVAYWIKRNLEGLLKKESVGKEYGHRLFKYVVWFLVSILVSQISMLLIYLFSGRPTGTAFLMITIFCTLGVVISNHFVAIHYTKNCVQSILVPVVIASLLLFIADRNSNLSVQVMAFFGLGEKSASVDLLLNKEGAEASEKLGLQNRCIPISDARLCDVQVLSRLGNEYLLKAGDQIFTLPKTVVISRISRPQPNPK
jgi:hypothetical protein